VAIDNDKLNKIQIDLSNTVTQLNVLVSRFESERETRRRRNRAIDEEMELIKDRLRDQEAWRNRWAGALIMLGILSTILGLAAIIITVTDKIK
jgi:hypothetical protein